MAATDEVNDQACTREAIPGRLSAAVVYVLYLGSVMAVVTAPVGVLIAHLKRGRVSPIAESHLLFQIRTFWWGVLAVALMLALWPLPVWLGLPGWVSWVFGYGFFTAFLIWTIARCGVGIHRLMRGLAINRPKSLWLGGAAVTLRDANKEMRNE